MYLETLIPNIKTTQPPARSKLMDGLKPFIPRSKTVSIIS